MPGVAGTGFFLTNSHCTSGFGTVDGEQAGQPDLYSPIGYEFVDPPLFTNAQDSSCPINRQCRYTDAAAFALYNVPFWQGHIARTPDSQITITDITSIIGESFGSYATGYTVAKEGSTTGYNFASVLSACVAVSPYERDAYGNQIDTGRTMLCQSKANYNSQPGDSGAPVFEDCGPASPPQRNPVCIAGINWGGDSRGSGTFSPWAYVQTELGGAFGPYAYLIPTGQ